MLKKHHGETRQVGYDASKPFGERTQYETKSGKLVEIHHKLERHDHDIVYTRVDTIEDYVAPMPNRVVQFLEETPEWIRRHLRIISGTIVRKSVLRRTVASEMQDTRFVSTSFGSPAIVLAGLYVPVGWSDRDMKWSGFFSSQKTCPPPPAGLKRFAGWCRKHWKGLTIANLALTLPVVIASFLFWQYGLEVGLSGSAIMLVVLLFIQFVVWFARSLDS